MIDFAASLIYEKFTEKSHKISKYPGMKKDRYFIHPRREICNVALVLLFHSICNGEQLRVDTQLPKHPNIRLKLTEVVGQNHLY